MRTIIDKIEDKVLKLLLKRLDRKAVEQYIHDMEKSYSKLSKKVKLTAAQNAEVQTFFQKHYKCNVPTVWHEYFYSRTGVFSPTYIPSCLYKTDIVGRLNVYPLKRAYTDKNITDIILPADVQPKIYLKNMNGYFYFNGNPVTKEEAIKCCSDLGAVIIKPSLTGRGVGVQKIDLKAGVNTKDNKSLATILDEYKSDFLIEELVSQHEKMAELNPSSVNTIRILTYRSGMDVNVVYTVVRIGRKDQPIDNESAGGISARIEADGKIAKYAYGTPGVDMVEYTDNGTKLDGFEIPYFHEAIELVKKMHYMLPYFNLVGWDIAITKEQKPILIEFNMTPDLSQSANGPAFGEYTELILKEAKEHKNTWTRNLQANMWRKR